MRIVTGVFDFIIINTIALPFVTVDVWTLVWYSLCVGLAFALRLGMMRKKGLLTWETTLIQSIYTISWCFFAVLVWNTFNYFTKGFEIYLFINSLFAVFMVGQFETIFEMGFKSWIRTKLKRLLAAEEREGEE